MRFNISITGDSHGFNLHLEGSKSFIEKHFIFHIPENYPFDWTRLFSRGAMYRHCETIARKARNTICPPIMIVPKRRRGLSRI